MFDKLELTNYVTFVMIVAALFAMVTVVRKPCSPASRDKVCAAQLEPMRERDEGDYGRGE